MRVTATASGTTAQIRVLATGLSGLGVPVGALGDAWEAHVRPLLESKRFKCHGEAGDFADRGHDARRLIHGINWALMAGAEFRFGR